MERYLRHNRLSETLDALGIAALCLLAGTLWFSWLWGLSNASLLAGAALGTLLWSARQQWRKRNVARREKALRSRLGAELMLEEMRMDEPKEAHCRAAMLLAARWPLTLLDAKDDGVVCQLGEEKLLIQCIRMPADGELSAGDLLAAQRAVRRRGAHRGVICPLGKVSPKIAARAEAAVVPLRIIQRSILLAVAGQLYPATDEQLVELGRRRRRISGQGSMRRRILHPDKAKRYHLYGLGMVLLYVMTGLRLYAVPGMVCLMLGVMSRAGSRQGDML